MKQLPEDFREAFNQVWQRIFLDHAHLDSALSKIKGPTKSDLAPWVPQLLRRPVTLSYDLEIPLIQGEPWSLEHHDEWKPAFEMTRAWLNRHYGHELPTPGSGSVIAKLAEQDFPPWMIQEWISDWGQACASQLAALLSETPGLSLRVNSRKYKNAEAIQDLARQLSGDQDERVEGIAPYAIHFDRYHPVLNDPHFKAGDYEIQDQGSQIMSLFALDPQVFGSILSKQPGQIESQNKQNWPVTRFPPLVVVDACAGAGGKSLAMADAMKAQGRVYAYDIFESKLKALRQRAKRSELRNIQTVLILESKSEETLSKFSKSADRVLVDAPCTGWGVLKRNPDIKWQGHLETVHETQKRLEDLQAKLLNAYSVLVKPGGWLTYGVCTFRKSETVDQAARFLKDNPQFTQGPGGFLGPGPTDGFYMQAFQRSLNG